MYLARTHARFCHAFWVGLLVILISLPWAVWAERGQIVVGAEVIEGEFLGRGVTCPQLRMTEGEQISLQGVRAGDIAFGAALKLTGTFVNISTCMQGRTFVVSELEITRPPDPN